jgi:hypothetical protein
VLRRRISWVVSPGSCSSGVANHMPGGLAASIKKAPVKGLFRKPVAMAVS